MQSSLPHRFRQVEDSSALRLPDVPHPDPFLRSLKVTRDLVSAVVPHVSNLEYLRWLEALAEEHAAKLGYPHEWLLGKGIMWFVARHEIDYRAESGQGDQLVLATWLRDLGRTKAWRDYLIFRPADETVICRATTLWVLVNLTSRRPARIPREMASAFAPQVVSSGKTR